jgi:hypothetical protein
MEPQELKPFACEGGPLIQGRAQLEEAKMGAC